MSEALIISIFDNARWPVAVIIMVLGAAALLRAPLSRALDRMTRAGKEGVEFAGQGTSEKQQADTSELTPSLPTVTAPSVPTLEPASPVLAKFEEAIIKDLDALTEPPDMKRARLIRSLAAHQLTWAHEVTFRLIAGSQLQLLVASNAFPRPTKSRANEIYAQAKADHPVVYRDFPFDAWLGFLIRRDLAKQEDQHIVITDIGRSFLHYLVEQNLTAPKFG